MYLAALVIRYVLSAFLIVLFARVLLSYFPIGPGTIMDKVAAFCRAVTDPILVPVRRLLPPVSLGGGATAIDLSPILVFFVVIVVLALV